MENAEDQNEHDPNGQLPIIRVTRKRRMVGPLICKVSNVSLDRQLEEAATNEENLRLLPNKRPRIEHENFDDYGDNSYGDDNDLIYRNDSESSDDEEEELFEGQRSQTMNLISTLAKAAEKSATANDQQSERAWLDDNEQPDDVERESDDLEEVFRRPSVRTDNSSAELEAGGTVNSGSAETTTDLEPEMHTAPGINTRIMATFPITPLVQHFIDVANSDFCDLEYPLDYNSPLDSSICPATDPDFKTKAEFCASLKEICSFYSIEKAGMKAFLDLLKEFLPKLNLPFTIVKTNGNLVWHPEKYVLIDKRRIVLDACINQCILYVGKYADLIVCPICSSRRFTKCDYGGTCPDGLDCNPAVNLSHKRVYRNAHQVAFYRPLIPKFLQMYRRDRRVFDHDSRRHKRPEFLTDIMDGSIPRAEMAAMDVIFQAKKIEWELANPGKKLVQQSLIFSLTYDGDLIYKRRASSLWPMLCSIMNCDPSYRTKLGLGLFMVINHSMRVGSGAEMALKNDLLTEELKQLFTGLLFEFVDDKGEEVALFLQARLVFLHCDTKGHEKNINVQATGSIAGCPFCGTTKGLSRSIISCCSYVGHTLYLFQNHVFRSMGEDGHQDGYFGELGEQVNKDFGKQITEGALKIKLKRLKKSNKKEKKTIEPSMSDDDYEVEQQDNEATEGGDLSDNEATEGGDLPDNEATEGGDLPDTFDVPEEGDFEDADFDETASVMSTTSRVSVRSSRPLKKRRVAPLVVNPSTINLRQSATLPEGKSYVSKLFPYSDFAPYMWLPRNDDRVYQELTLVTNEQFIANSAAADLLKEQYETDVANGTRRAKMNPTFPVNGVHPNIPKFFSIGSFRLEYLTPDLMHAAALSISYLIALISGLRGVSNKSRKLSIYQFRFPFMQDLNNPVPFVASLLSRRLADSVHYCLNIPLPYKKDYSYDFPFHYQGSMNSHETLVFMVCFASYIISFTNISRVYKRFFERYSWDLCQVLNPFLRRDFLSYLCQHVIETKVIQEGIFPDSDQNFICHQLIHIVAHLEKFGPAKALMCFFSERAMKALSDGVPDGGQKFVITCTDRFVDKENTYERNFAAYCESFKLNSDNAGVYSSQVLKLTGNFKPVVLNHDMKDILFNNLNEFIGSQEVRYRNVKSSFYRIYFTFEEVFKLMDEDVSYGISKWVSKLMSVARDGFHSQSFLHLGITNVLMEPDVTLNLTGNENLTELNAYIESELVLKRILYATDLTGIIADMARFGTRSEPIAAFTHATVKGVQFTARGSNFSETKLVAEDHSGTERVGLLPVEYVLDNPLNELNNNWYQLYQYSCWARVKDWYSLLDNKILDTVKVNERSYFAQLNYFFRLYFPHDKILNGLAFANAILRKPGSQDIDKVRRHFWVDPSAKSYHPDKHFVSLNYFEGTALAVSALDAESLPLMNPTRAAKEMIEIVLKYPLILSPLDATDVNRLYFIELHPERMAMSYRKVEEDLDQTKLMEPEVLTYYENFRNM